MEVAVMPAGGLDSIDPRIGIPVAIIAWVVWAVMARRDVVKARKEAKK